MTTSKYAWEPGMGEISGFGAAAVGDAEGLEERELERDAGVLPVVRAPALGRAHDVLGDGPEHDLGAVPDHGPAGLLVPAQRRARLDARRGPTVGVARDEDPEQADRHVLQERQKQG